MGRERVACLAAKRRLNPGISLNGRLPLHKNSSQIALTGQPRDDAFEDRCPLFLQVVENLHGEVRRHMLENFVGLHGIVRAAAGETTSGIWVT